MLHTCPSCNLCSKCYAMDCFGTCFTHVGDVTCAQSATPWTASVHTVHTLHTSRNPGWGGGGWGGVQWHALYLHTYSMLRNCTCAHVGCDAIALAHVFDATQLHLRTCWMLRNCTCDATQLHLRTCSMLRNCTCAHVRCYAIALAHMLDATQLHLHTCSMHPQLHVRTMLDATQLHLRTCWMLRNCTCAHVRCYAIALAHMVDATQLHLRTCWMPRNCTCAHVGCFAIALAHMFDATQLHLRTCSMLRQRKPTKRKAKECLQMSANFSKRGSSNGHGVLNSWRVNPHLSKQQFPKHLAKVC